MLARIPREGVIIFKKYDENSDIFKKRLENNNNGHS